jgi:hypothetical protein
MIDIPKSKYMRRKKKLEEKASMFVDIRDPDRIARRTTRRAAPS